MELEGKTERHKREGKGIRMDGEGYLKENGKKEEIFEKCKGFICV